MRSTDPKLSWRMVLITGDVINERIGLFRAGADSDKARAEAS